MKFPFLAISALARRRRGGRTEFALSCRTGSRRQLPPGPDSGCFDGAGEKDRAAEGGAGHVVSSRLDTRLKPRHGRRARRRATLDRCDRGQFPPRRRCLSATASPAEAAFDARTTARLTAVLAHAPRSDVSAVTLDNPRPLMSKPLTVTFANGNGSGSTSRRLNQERRWLLRQRSDVRWDEAGAGR